jgi:hypothetical protein
MDEIAVCDHCHTKQVVVADYGRNPDVLTKYMLCADCAGMSDAEFFGTQYDPMACHSCQKVQPETMQTREGELWQTCLDCSALSDDEFFHRTQTPSGEELSIQRIKRKIKEWFLYRKGFFPVTVVATDECSTYWTCGVYKDNDCFQLDTPDGEVNIPWTDIVTLLITRT